MGSNSTSDTSNDVDVSFKYSNKVDVTHKEESVYWTDDGDENEEEVELKKLDGLSKCLQCGTDDKPTNIRYCRVCWKERKDWIPSYSKSFNKRRRKLRQSNNQETKQQTDIALDHSTTTTPPPTTTTATTTTTITVGTDTKHLCMFCMTRERTTSLVHGHIAHQVVIPTPTLTLLLLLLLDLLLPMC